VKIWNLKASFEIPHIFTRIRIMLKQGPLRVLVGMVIGFAGGSSLITAIFPFAMGQLLKSVSFDMVQLFSFAWPVIILWIIGGGLIGWYGGGQTGALIMGLCGAIAGFALTAFALSGSLLLILVGTGVGLVYGAVGGLIIGAAFSNSVDETS
jgi:hypothetical protein